MSSGSEATVAVASFNTLALLRVVCGAVRETAPGAELLVIDTGSRDGSREWARGRAWLRTVEIDGAAPGAAAHGAALDRAVEVAARPLLATLDSDAIPLDARWLDALAAELGDADACGTTKDPGELPLLRRIFGGRPRGPEWEYIRPNRALYRVETLRRRGLSFAGAHEGEALGRALAPSVRLIEPARMNALVLHLRHASMALNPHLFPKMRGRDVRAARARIDAFLATELARRYEEAAAR